MAKNRLLRDFVLLWLRGGISLQILENAFAQYKMYAIKIGPVLLKKMLNEGSSLAEICEAVKPTVSKYFVTETQIGDENIILDIMNETVRSIDLPEIQNGMQELMQIIAFVGFNQAIAFDSASKHALSLWFKTLMFSFIALEKLKKAETDVSHKIRQRTSSIKLIMEGLEAWTKQCQILEDFTDAKIEEDDLFVITYLV